MAQACCEAGLQSSTELWGSCFALTSAAVHWCCITVQLCEEQISIGVIAVTQACSEPDSHSSTKQWGACFALTSAAVHWCCITARLYEGQISRGAIAVAQACCEAILQSSTEAKQAPHCSVLLCKSGSEHAYATAITPMEICPSYRCALMQTQCTAAVEIHLWKFALHTAFQ